MSCDALVIGNRCFAERTLGRRTDTDIADDLQDLMIFIDWLVPVNNPSWQSSMPYDIAHCPQPCRYHRHHHHNYNRHHHHNHNYTRNHHHHNQDELEEDILLHSVAGHLQFMLSILQSSPMIQVNTKGWWWWWWLWWLLYTHSVWWSLGIWWIMLDK